MKIIKRFESFKESNYMLKEDYILEIFSEFMHDLKIYKHAYSYYSNKNFNIYFIIGYFDNKEDREIIREMYFHHDQLKNILNIDIFKISLINNFVILYDYKNEFGDENYLNKIKKYRDLPDELIRELPNIFGKSNVINKGIDFRDGSSSNLSLYDWLYSPYNDPRKISENVKYHLDNKITFTKNIFRTGSESFYKLLEEVRILHDNGQLILEGLDKNLYESTDIGRFGTYEGQRVPLDIPMINDIINEKSEYRGRKVDLNKPMRSSGPKKYKVYVRDPKTKNVKVVHFGDAKGGLKAKISDPKARSSFSKRHGCETRHKDKTKAGYWSCRLTKFGHLFGGRTYPGYW